MSLSHCIDRNADRVFHDTMFADGTNLYQLDHIQRCLSETEFARFIHQMGVMSVNNLNTTHLTGCGDDLEKIRRAFDSNAWKVFNRDTITIEFVGDKYLVLHNTGLCADMKFLWVITAALLLSGPRVCTLQRHSSIATSSISINHEVVGSHRTISILSCSKS